MFGFPCIFFICIDSKVSEQHQSGSNVTFILLKSNVIHNSKSLLLPLGYANLVNVSPCQHMHMVDVQFRETARHTHESHVIGRERMERGVNRDFKEMDEEKD